ncbi:MAG: hypothetical protein PHX10_11965 [Gallionellaceae bacterium]|nr:hypothetical protein [Gallionellaceae bacterium]
MKNRFITLLFLPLVGQGCANGTPTASLCDKGETVYFACQIMNMKRINLCGSLPQNLQYRFGTPTRVELRYPENAEEGPKALRLAHYARYQTDRIEVSFQNGGADYALFDYFEDNHRRAGVRVTTADGREREILCTGSIAGRLGALEASLPCDADNALNGGVCP